MATDQKRLPLAVLIIITIGLVNEFGCIPFLPTPSPLPMCGDAMPEPELDFVGTEDYYDGFGTHNVRFYLRVTNWSDYPDELFDPAPYLEPCGNVTDASRAWVDIYAAGGTRIYRFCGLTSPSSLQDIWFSDVQWRSAMGSSSSPDRVYVVIWDRLCGTTYRSNTLTLAEAECDQEVPDPEVEFTECEPHTDAFGNSGTRYRLRVTNWSDYPEELFEPAPELGVCDENDEPSRTWVDIYAANGQRIYGFCGLDGPDHLTNIWFSDLQWQFYWGPFPDRIYVTITDRLCDRTWSSDLVNVSCGGGSGTITGRVVDAQTGWSLSGVLVEMSDSSQTTTTNSSGSFTLDDVVEGQHELTFSKSGYAGGSATVTLESGGEVDVTVGLMQCDGDDMIAIVLTWGTEEGAHPRDLDVHMSGPDGQGGRFHVCYWNTAPVEHAYLDRDDQDFGGPETITIRPGADGDFVPGEYRIWVHNYLQSPEFDDSLGVVSVTAGCAPWAQHTVGTNSGDPSLDIWRVMNITVTSYGSISYVDPEQYYTDGDSYTEF